MRILFIIIQALFILTGCTAVQDGRGRNIQNESTDQRDAKPIHVKIRLLRQLKIPAGQTSLSISSR